MLAGVTAIYFIAGFIILWCFGMRPSDATKTSMWVMKRRIMRYAHEHGRLPTSLSELPDIQGTMNRNVDWWGNPITYVANQDGLVTLRSPGGPVWGYSKREGAPIERSFWARASDGEWSDELVDFIEQHQGQTQDPPAPLPPKKTAREDRQ